MALRSSATSYSVTSEECALGRFHRPTAPGSEAPRGPDSVGPFPGIVLIHDVWGLSEHSEALAKDLAAAGFGVLEINLYRRRGEFVIEDVGAQIRSLSDPEVLSDLEDGADWLTASEFCRGRKVGVFGVCMGGSFCLLAACRSDRFAAATPFYGVLSYDHGLLADPVERDRVKKPFSPIEAAKTLRTPTLASFGRDDQMVPLSDVDELEAGLSTSGVAFEIDRYSGAGHAFLNHTRAEAYRPEVAATAWARVIPFLHTELD